MSLNTVIRLLQTLDTFFSTPLPATDEHTSSLFSGSSSDIKLTKKKPASRGLNEFSTFHVPESQIPKSVLAAMGSDKKTTASPSSTTSSTSSSSASPSDTVSSTSSSYASLPTPTPTTSIGKVLQLGDVLPLQLGSKEEVIHGLCVLKGCWISEAAFRIRLPTAPASSGLEAAMSGFVSGTGLASSAGGAASGSSAAGSSLAMGGGSGIAGMGVGQAIGIGIGVGQALSSSMAAGGGAKGERLPTYRITRQSAYSLPPLQNIADAIRLALSNIRQFVDYCNTKAGAGGAGGAGAGAGAGGVEPSATPTRGSTSSGTATGLAGTGSSASGTSASGPRCDARSLALLTAAQRALVFSNAVLHERSPPRSNATSPADRCIFTPKLPPDVNVQITVERLGISVHLSSKKLKLFSVIYAPSATLAMVSSILIDVLQHLQLIIRNVQATIQTESTS